jgi:DNA (cytosine-5)-methyltransferase 1
MGWTPVFFSEIEKFPNAVLSQRWPKVPNLGDMTKFKGWRDERIDLLVGGTPCQSFSVAGLRRGLDDPRGNLALVFLAIVDRLRPKWVVWENVPGVRSTNEGRGLAAFLGGLGQLGYGWAYRSLDAQYFGLAQRRERLFVVGHLGDWRRAGAVLLERQSLSGNPAPSREKGQGVAADIAPSLVSSGRGVERAGDSRGQDPVVAITPPLSMCLNGKGGSLRMDAESETLIPSGGGFDLAHTLKGEGFDASEDGTGRGIPLIAFNNRQDPVVSGDLCQPLSAKDNGQAIAFSCKDYGADAGELSPTLRAMGHDGSHPNAGGQVAVRQGMRVRRLTPRECERLQGFPDDYTLITYRKKLAADGPRYKAIGNSMPVPIMRWIGRRIDLVS